MQVSPSAPRRALSPGSLCSWLWPAGSAGPCTQPFLPLPPLCDRQGDCTVGGQAWCGCSDSTGGGCRFSSLSPRRHLCYLVSGHNDPLTSSYGCPTGKENPGHPECWEHPGVSWPTVCSWPGVQLPGGPSCLCPQWGRAVPSPPLFSLAEGSSWSQIAGPQSMEQAAHSMNLRPFRATHWLFLILFILVKHTQYKVHHFNHF